MLESLQTNDYAFDSFTQLNDNLLYLDYIDRNYEFKTATVTPDVGYRFQGQLFALFNTLNIEKNLYVYTMYLNGYTSPMNYDGKQLTFKVAIRPPVPLS